MNGNQKRIVKVLFATILMASALTAMADQTEANEQRMRVRGKVGYTFFTGTKNFADELDETSAGLDFSYRLLEHFEIGVSASRVFLAAGSQVYVVGLTPTWGINYKRLHLYAGGLVGLMAIHDTFPTTAQLDITRPSVGLVSGADIAIIGGLEANVSMQYAKAIGPEEKLGALGLMAGLGYKF